MERRRLVDCKSASNGSSLEGEHLIIWSPEEARTSREKVIPSATDKALAEEGHESFDHSGVLKENTDGGPGMDDKGCWDMVEFNKDPNLARGVEWNTERIEFLQACGEKEDRWEERDKNSSQCRRGVVRSLGSGRFLDWRALDADGTAGIQECGGWDCLGVYGSLWSFHQRGKRGTVGRAGGCKRDLGRAWAGRPSLQGGAFTWSGGLNNQSWARLDRFLVSPSWLDKFSGVNQRRLPRPVSDHFPILLEGGGLRRGPSPFRFENMWLKVEGFLDLVRGWWREIEVRGTASYRLAAKTKELKQKLKSLE
ncbi:hypothetical protein CK203_090926 [Vitis vinifera]|uniref:Endonuclease/exonuclease/phosphatase domain-containing protein n=1 Tax=Vitis vinifera TaxID=29760 RepID=A0A438DRU4_VITVI|nr:hypothetical protein CK203_090926 [Vitis vinifera]